MNVSKETIRSELERLGYTGISDDQLTQFKADLDKLLEKELKRCGGVLSPEVYTFSDDSPAVQPNPITIVHDDNQKTQSSNCREEHTNKQRIVKRKTLRHLNGKAYISEESLSSTCTSFVSCLNEKPDLRGSNPSGSSEDEYTSSDFADDDSLTAEPILSKVKDKNGGFKGNSRLPVKGYGMKPCDPVLRYHQYKKYWDAYKPPGEKIHKELRQFIREQMSDYDPIVDFSLQNVPNIAKRRNLPRRISSSNLPL